MFSAEADALVSEAVRRFVLEARNMVGSVALGAPRLALVQDRAVEGAAGRHYDEFMGHRDTPLASGDLPEAYFQPGEYDEE